METNKINDYIRGLKYDPRALLSITDSDHPETLPGKSTTTKNSVIICTNIRRRLTKEISNVSILSPANGVIYPGALILANRSLAEGKPEALTLKRAPVTLRVDLPGLDQNGIMQIDQPSNSSVQTAIDNAVTYWLENVASKKHDHAARVDYSVTKAYSNNQLSVALGFSSKWAGNELSNKLDFKKSNNQSTTVAMFKQIYYTVTLDLPKSPADVFADDVTLEDIQQSLSKDDPAAYVKSVDFGRIIMVRMDTEGSASKSDTENTLKMVTSGGAEFDAEAKTKYESVAKRSTFTVLVLGGGAKVSSEIFNGDSFSKVKSVIINGIQLGKNNPAYPISYTVNFLRDHKFAIMPLTTDYVETDCIEYPSGYVKVLQEGGYVGKWEVTWHESDENGHKVPRKWESGNKTSPYSRTIPLPGDATHVNVSAWAMTGLVWDQWREAINVTENGPTNKTYKIWGTTLSPQHAVY